MTPYRIAAEGYFELGWSPIPLPHESKSPVPDEATGASGRYVDAVQLRAWLRGRANAGKLSYVPTNIALRMPKDVIGIDVDNYGTKKGKETLGLAEDAWGPLPPTWRSSSRDDGLSGIYYFRIPEGLAWPGELPQGKGVELVRWDHRYAVVEPSVHDETKAVYRWYRPGSAAPEGDDGDWPEPHELPDLPDEWVTGLTSGARWADTPVDEEMSARDIQEWLAARPTPNGEPCSVLRRALADWDQKISAAAESGGAHDAARDGVWALMKEAAYGHGGVATALTRLRKTFLASVGKRRAKNGEAMREWARMLSRGVRKVSAELAGDEASEDPCSSIRASSRPSGSKQEDWRCDDLGNANRLVRVMDGRARWVPARGAWYVWRDEVGYWKADNAQVERWFFKAANQMREMAAYLEDEKTRAAFESFAKSSGNIGRMRAGVDTAKSRIGIELEAEELDSNPGMINCPNGTIHLGEKKAKLKPHRREDFLTGSTGVDYNPGAVSEVWEHFMVRVCPDPEVRSWVQRLVGYSLLGENPERLIIAVVGPTSTGKSTFAEAIRAALGDYGDTMTPSVLRDNQDDRPRPDLLRVLTKRLVIAEELSAAQHLHPDQIKRLVGNITVTARAMRSDDFETRLPAFTPWLVTNETPTIEGADEAIRRRLVVVPFEHQISRGKQDLKMRKRLQAPDVREAILAWAVRGYEMYVEELSRGRSIAALPSGAVAVNKKFADEMSPFDTFCSEALEFGPDCSVPAGALWDAYQMWCENAGIKIGDKLNRTTFGRHLNNKGTTPGVNSAGVRVRNGVQLSAEYQIING